jgi:AcrR family transcriptional regulator
MPAVTVSPAPERTRATPLPPAERRAAIVQAVAPLLLEHGAGITTKQIAHGAGVAEGTIFNVFADKDELIEAVIAAALDPQPLEQRLAAIDATQPFEARLVAATEEVQLRMMYIWRLIAALGPRTHRGPHQLPQSPGLTAIFAAEPARVRVEPAVAARRLRAMTVTLTHPFMTSEPATPEEIVDAFLHGVAARAGAS